MTRPSDEVMRLEIETEKEGQRIRHMMKLEKENHQMRRDLALLAELRKARAAYNLAAHLLDMQKIEPDDEFYSCDLPEYRELERLRDLVELGE